MFYHIFKSNNILAKMALNGAARTDGLMKYHFRLTERNLAIRARF